VFDPASGGSGSSPRRLCPPVIARLHGAAKRHANWHELDEAETAAAVAELREILGSRDDGPALLAQVTGVLLGACEGELDEA
jgi:hypothetical protein